MKFAQHLEKSQQLASEAIRALPSGEKATETVTRQVLNIRAMKRVNRELCKLAYPAAGSTLEKYQAEGAFRGICKAAGGKWAPYAQTGTWQNEVLAHIAPFCPSSTGATKPQDPLLLKHQKLRKELTDLKMSLTQSPADPSAPNSSAKKQLSSGGGAGVFLLGAGSVLGCVALAIKRKRAAGKRRVQRAANPSPADCV